MTVSQKTLPRSKVNALVEKFEKVFGHPPLQDMHTMTTEQLRAQKAIIKAVEKDAQHA
jgi:hypothetical protein